MPRREASSSGRRPPSERRRTKSVRKGIVLLGVIVLMGILGVMTGVGVMLWRIPSVETLLANRPHGVTTIYDRNGKLVASLQNGENREIIHLSDISLQMQHAVIASEDIRFYQHHGIDPRGVARAVLTLGHDGGGSTLTQQLAKNLFLSFDRTLSRKLADMWLAVQLERTLSKDQILEMYLNQVYFGSGAYGVEAASLRYFGIHARSLNAAQAAMLAGMLPAPEYYSPYRHPDAAKEVQEKVLKRMVDAGYLTPEQAVSEAHRHLYHPGGSDYAYRAPYFVTQVLSLLSDRLGGDMVMRGGLKIYTTMDLGMQEEAEQLIKSGVARYRRQRVSQGALVAIEPGTGAVRALVGGTDYSLSQFNRATQAHRQPGSTFKPFVYVTAFAHGYTPYSTVLDAPVSFGKYTPVNYERDYRGEVTFAAALAHSLNVPAVKVANEVGIDNVVKTAHLAGIKSNLPPELSIALGSAEVTPLELTDAYATFAANGTYAEPQFVTKIEDANGNVIEQNQPQTVRAIDPGAVASLDVALQGVINHGTGVGAYFGRPACGKTGTTSENRDTWFAGYTPNLACVIWLGNDDNSRLASYATGGELAAPLWGRFMRFAHQGIPVQGFSRGDAGASQANNANAVDGTASGVMPAGGASGAAAPVVVTPQPADTVPPGAQEGQPLQESLPSQAPANAEPTTAPVDNAQDPQQQTNAQPSVLTLP